MYHLRQLQCALALARHRHFGRAAEDVGITQSGLTQSINRLEDYYGVRLFSRDSKPVAPTVFGDALLKGAAQVLERMQTMEREIKLLNDLETGQLVVGVDPMLATSMLAPALTSLLRTHPRLRFSVRSGGWQTLAPELAAHDIDLLIGFTDTTDTGQFESADISQPAPLVVGAPDHPLRHRKRRSLSDFLAYPLVQGPVARWYLDWAGTQLAGEKVSMDLHEPYFLHADDTTLLITIAKGTHALLAAMREDVEVALKAGELVEITPPRWPRSVTVTVAWPKQTTIAPAAERLLTELGIAASPSLPLPGSR